MERGKRDLNKVKCRVCRKEINYRGYKDHLKAQHPEEDCEVLRDFNQPTVFGGLKRKKSGEEEEMKKQTEEEEKLDEEEKPSEEEEKLGMRTSRGRGKLTKWMVS